MVLSLQEVLQNPEVIRNMQEHPNTFRFSEEVDLMVAVMQRPPHVFVREAEDGSIVISGPMANVLNILADSINFTYRLVLPEDGTFGTLLPNGNWSGMLELVVNHKADITLGPFGFDSNRMKAFEFTRSFFTSDVCILAGKGQPEVDPWGFLFPLEPVVWAVLIAALVVAWLAMVLLGNNNNKSSGFLKWASDTFFQHLRILLRQDMMVLYRSSEMVLVMGWMVVTMMVMWSYGGNLVSLLAVRHIPQPLHTIRHVTNASNIKVIMPPRTLVTAVLAKSKSGPLKALDQLRHVGRVKYQSRTFERTMDTLVRRGDHVIISTRLTLDSFINTLHKKNGRCDFYKVGEALFSLTHCMIGQKGSPLIPVISSKLRGLVESGLYEHWVLRGMPFLSYCHLTPSKITVRKPLALSNIWGMLVVLGAGLLLALVTLCLEIYIDKLGGDGAL
ncbi:glutamate receptor ionotropic, kainate 5-like isoform X2 [Homarus americanus]|uniref:glutamate receptor ionotropic, kainate 5-like isoform X2 n=1 Tax=Homarus americanus TaxID=6706 RepID=UPI001C4506D8|nr:glutamate receptor ionotropic, kainate 5-like isoform X2 [Homarus americanus]